MSSNRIPGLPVHRRRAVANCVRNLSFALVILLSVTSGSITGAHETQPDWPTAEQLAEVPPPMDHSIPMARKLIAHLRHRLDSNQLELLDEVHHHLQVMQLVDSGQLGAERQPSALSKIRLVEYFRWQAECSLRTLLDNLSSNTIVELDFREGRPQHSPDEPILINSQHNLVLLRVRSGASNLQADDIFLSMESWDLIHERPDGHFSVNIASSGVSYVLVDLKQLPSDRTTALLTFQDAVGKKPLYTYALTLKAAPRGQIAVDVVDDSDRSVPVLMSIASHNGGEMWEPAEAIDLRPVLNDVVPHLSPSGRGYMFYLFGQRRGRYWIVKPPLEMPLPAGKWDIRVLRGLEYSPIRKTVTVEADQWTRIKLQPKRWTDMPKRGWYSGDDHVHARLETSEDARKLLDYTRAVDIHVANILEMGDVMRTYYPQRGYGTDFRVRHDNHWLIPGQEDPRSVLGHAIGLNLQSKVRDLDRYLSNDWIAGQIHDQGGLYGHTHVGPNACFVHREMALFTPDGIVDFNSIMQATLGTDLYYDFLNLGFKMTASAGADTPYGGTIGAVRTYAYTGNPESFAPDEWFASLKNGHTFVTNGPMIEFKINDAIPGDVIVVDDDERLKVTAKSWGDLGVCHPVSLRLVKLGKTIQEVVAPNRDQASLSLSTEIESGHGCWLAVHATAVDGSQAHTTPIYVSRKGFRHWNIGEAEMLIERQLATLREIESEVRKSERIVETNDSSLDYWNRRTANQADQVRSKVEVSRKFYEDLRDTLEIEIEQREQRGLDSLQIREPVDVD